MAQVTQRRAQPPERRPSSARRAPVRGSTERLDGWRGRRSSVEEGIGALLWKSFLEGFLNGHKR